MDAPTEGKGRILFAALWKLDAARTPVFIPNVVDTNNDKSLCVAPFKRGAVRVESG
jgi:hypothetical protein